MDDTVNTLSFRLATGGGVGGIDGGKETAPAEHGAHIAMLPCESLRGGGREGGREGEVDGTTAPGERERGKGEMVHLLCLGPPPSFPPSLPPSLLPSVSPPLSRPGRTGLRR